jgi:hypothetical protein
MPDSGERVFDCRMCRWARSAVGGVGVEVVCREGPSKMPVQVKRSFDLVEGSYDGRVAGVAPLVTDGCALVVVHAVLDAQRGLVVPRATVIHVNDWTSYVVVSRHDGASVFSSLRRGVPIYV